MKNINQDEDELENIDLSNNLGRSSGEDSLSYYIRKVNTYSILSVEEEMDLANSWLKDKNEKSAHKLLTAHLKLVVKLASQYKRYGFPMEDLIAEGSLGLLKSLKNFQPELGHRFSTYARWWIKAQIKEFVLHNWSLVKMGTTRSQKRLFFSLRKTKYKIQNEEESFGGMTDSNLLKIAKELDLPLEDVKSMNARMGNRDFSLNATLMEGEGEETEWQDWLVEESPNPEESYLEEDEFAKRKRMLETAMASLSEREAGILHHRYMQEEPATLEFLGKHYNLSRERIRQIEGAAFKKLQASLLKECADKDICSLE